MRQPGRRSRPTEPVRATRRRESARPTSLARSDLFAARLERQRQNGRRDPPKERGGAERDPGARRYAQVTRLSGCGRAGCFASLSNLAFDSRVIVGRSLEPGLGQARKGRPARPADRKKVAKGYRQPPPGLSALETPPQFVVLPQRRPADRVLAPDPAGLFAHRAHRTGHNRIQSRTISAPRSAIAP